MKLTLKEWRGARGISQQEMADACGVHVNTYRSWEEDPINIKINHVFTITKILKITLDDIILPNNTTKTSI